MIPTVNFWIQCIQKFTPQKIVFFLNDYYPCILNATQLTPANTALYAFSQGGAITLWYTLCTVRHATRMSPRNTRAVPSGPDWGGVGAQKCVSVGRTCLICPHYP